MLVTFCFNLPSVDFYLHPPPHPLSDCFDWSSLSLYWYLYAGFSVRYDWWVTFLKCFLLWWCFLISGLQGLDIYMCSPTWFPIFAGLFTLFVATWRNSTVTPCHQPTLGLVGVSWTAVGFCCTSPSPFLSPFSGSASKQRRSKQKNFGHSLLCTSHLNT